jgi:hypothetical protein
MNMMPRQMPSIRKFNIFIKLSINLQNQGIAMHSPFYEGSGLKLNLSLQQEFKSSDLV